MQPRSFAAPPKRPISTALALAAVLLLAAARAPAAGTGDAPVAPFRADYALHALGMTVGTSHWQLTDTPGGFLFRTNSDATGLFALLHDEAIHEQTLWKRSGGRLRPVEYRYRRTGKKRRLVTVRFDWKRMRAYNTVNGDRWQLPIPEGTVDKLGYMLLLMHDVAHGARSMRYTIADGGKLKHYAFRVTGAQRMDTSLGDMPTLRVVRVGGDSRRSTTIWLAPSLGYLPVRIVHRERNGDDVSLTLRSLSRDAAS